MDPTDSTDALTRAWADYLRRSPSLSVVADIAYMLSLGGAHSLPDASFARLVRGLAFALDVPENHWGRLADMLSSASVREALRLGLGSAIDWMRNQDTLAQQMVDFIASLLDGGSQTDVPDANSPDGGRMSGT